MARPLHILVASAAAAFGISAAPLPRVVIEVDGVSPGRGQVLLGLCRETEFLTASCAYQTLLPVKNSRVVRAAVTVKPGRYAVQAVYDVNRNGRMDSNMMGIPLEPVAFSRAPDVRSGPPRFADAAIDIAQAMRIQVRLK